MSDHTCLAPDGRIVTFPEEFSACCVPVLANEYMVPEPGTIPDEPPCRTLLDLGAGVGAFSLWALKRWPGIKPVCVEPDPTLLKYLAMNVPEASIVPAAVTARPESHAVLYRGPNGHYGYNTVEPELTGNPSGSSVDVAKIHPRDLPAADVIKLDIEGAEGDVIKHWLYFPQCWWVVLEWHSGERRLEWEVALAAYGFRLVAGRVLDAMAGLEIWCKTRARVNRGQWRYEL